MMVDHEVGGAATDIHRHYGSRFGVDILFLGIIIIRSERLGHFLYSHSLWSDEFAAQLVPCAVEVVDLIGLHTHRIEPGDGSAGQFAAGEQHLVAYEHEQFLEVSLHEQVVAPRVVPLQVGPCLIVVVGVFLLVVETDVVVGQRQGIPSLHHMSGAVAQVGAHGEAGYLALPYIERHKLLHEGLCRSAVERLKSLLVDHVDRLLRTRVERQHLHVGRQHGEGHGLVVGIALVFDMRVGGTEVDGKLEDLAALLHIAEKRHEHTAGDRVGDQQIVVLLFEAEILRCEELLPLVGTVHLDVLKRLSLAVAVGIDRVAVLLLLVARRVFVDEIDALRLLDGGVVDVVAGEEE